MKPSSRDLEFDTRTLMTLQSKTEIILHRTKDFIVVTKKEKGEMRVLGLWLGSKTSVLVQVYKRNNFCVESKWYQV